MAWVGVLAYSDKVTESLLCFVGVRVARLWVRTQGFVHVRCSLYHCATALASLLVLPWCFRLASSSVLTRVFCGLLSKAHTWGVEASPVSSGDWGFSGKLSTSITVRAVP